MRNWAILGSEGFIAKRHRKAIQEIGDTLLITCDPNGGDFRDPEQLFKSNLWKRITHVSICTPNDTHENLLRRLSGMSDGKTILCEKPLLLKTDGSGFLTDNMYTVLQLRYNPLLERMLNAMVGSSSIISLTIKAFREPAYWESWKGDPRRSGGILFNMGIHYIDVLLYLLGTPTSLQLTSYDEKYLAKGVIRTERGEGRFHIELLREPGETERTLTLNGNPYELEGATIPLHGKSLNLHTEVYRELVAHRGIHATEALGSIGVVEQLINA